MKRSIVWLLLLFAVDSLAQVKQRGLFVSGEEAEHHWRERRQLGELYRRISASRFVVVGTVVTSNEILERGKRPSMDDDAAGQLYTIATEQVLCRQEEASPNTATSPGGSQREFHLFVPAEPFVEGVQEKERLSRDQRYLLFLAVPDQKQQKIWTDSFALDPQFVYYRGEELSRGVIPLARPTAENPNPLQPAVFDKVTQLCQAMRQASLEDKLTELNRLAASDDPVLRKEAQEAMFAIRTSQH
jgi:hypothetical protein